MMWWILWTVKNSVRNKVIMVSCMSTLLYRSSTTKSNTGWRGIPKWNPPSCSPSSEVECVNVPMGFSNLVIIFMMVVIPCTRRMWEAMICCMTSLSYGMNRVRFQTTWAPPPRTRRKTSTTLMLLLLLMMMMIMTRWVEEAKTNEM